MEVSEGDVKVEVIVGDVRVEVGTIGCCQSGGEGN